MFFISDANETKEMSFIEAVTHLKADAAEGITYPVKVYYAIFDRILEKYLE
jgi:hypothetical protein